MNWLQRLFGKKVKESVSVPYNNRPMVTRIIKRDGDDKTYSEPVGYDPSDMLNPLNPFSPLSPFWIGDQDSIGDVHELVDQTPEFSGFGSGQMGGGAGSEFDTNDGSDTPTYPQSDDYSSQSDDYSSSNDDFGSSSDDYSSDSGSSDSDSSD